MFKGLSVSKGGIMTDIKFPPIIEKWFEYKRSKIKQYPQNCLRASSIGHPCKRYHYHSIHDWKEKQLHDEVRQSIYDEGNFHEKVLISELHEMGFEVVEQQRSFQLEDPKITGHIDGILRYDNKDFPFDCKSINSNDYQKLDSLEDFLYSKKYYQANYVIQLLLYLLMSGNEYGCLILKNKITGEIKPIWAQIDYIKLDDVLKRAKEVYKALETNLPPDRIDNLDLCSKCDFRHICLPDMKFGDGVQVLDDAELLELLNRRELAKDSAEEFAEADELIKASVKTTGVGEKICGDFIIKVTSYTKETKIPLTWDTKQDEILKCKIARIGK
jgi:CRISPR/Cas system-associated exonuclease Cas4 (RecB family)